MAKRNPSAAYYGLLCLIYVLYLGGSAIFGGHHYPVTIISYAMIACGLLALAWIFAITSKMITFLDDRIAQDQAETIKQLEQDRARELQEIEPDIEQAIESIKRDSTT